MKIIELRASNVKRLRAIDITPDGTLQVIGGRNAQGKSSVLDAIWLALGGGDAKRGTTKPIRDGEDHAEVTLDLGEFVVTRRWTQSGTTLTVTSPDGASYKSPQSLLDGLVGKLSFDPLEFTRLSAREQREALLGLVDLDVNLDALEADRQRLYEQRTEIGRQGKAMGDVPEIDGDLPEQEQSASGLIGRIREAQDQEAYLSTTLAQLKAAQDDTRSIQQQIEALTSRLEIRTRETESLTKIISEAERAERVDIALLEAQLSVIESTNAAIRANNAAKNLFIRKSELRKQYDDLTHKIELTDSTKRAALASATFPVDGLGFDESGVTYQGVPFSQASSAEQIRVSLAMAMALNPKLRVLRIKDGSLLDDESMATIREQVAEQDFQLWIERVGESDKGAVIIEDGEVSA